MEDKGLFSDTDEELSEPKQPQEEVSRINENLFERRVISDYKILHYYGKKMEKVASGEFLSNKEKIARWWSKIRNKCYRGKNLLLDPHSIKTRKLRFEGKIRDMTLREFETYELTDEKIEEWKRKLDRPDESSLYSSNDQKLRKLKKDLKFYKDAYVDADQEKKELKRKNKNLRDKLTDYKVKTMSGAENVKAQGSDEDFEGEKKWTIIDQIEFLSNVIEKSESFQIPGTDGRRLYSDFESPEKRENLINSKWYEIEEEFKEKWKLIRDSDIHGPDGWSVWLQKIFRKELEECNSGKKKRKISKKEKSNALTYNNDADEVERRKKRHSGLRSKRKSSSSIYSNRKRFKKRFL